jgi:hypothetical protein
MTPRTGEKGTFASVESSPVPPTMYLAHLCLLFKQASLALLASNLKIKFLPTFLKI